MNDRELLELAAKAAGLPVEFEVGECNGWYVCGRTDDGDVAEWWNPLTDDGDALRLSVALRLSITHVNSEFVAVETLPSDRNQQAEWQWFEHYADSLNKCAATRRAITRAAAELGRARA